MPLEKNLALDASTSGFLQFDHRMDSSLHRILIFARAWPKLRFGLVPNFTSETDAESASTAMTFSGVLWSEMSIFAEKSPDGQYHA